MKRPLTSAEKDELIGLLAEIFTTSQVINDGFERTPGEDAYVYKGSMNSIETLREEHAELLEFRFRTGWSPSTEARDE